jgi:hypothetical protein
MTTYCKYIVYGLGCLEKRVPVASEQVPVASKLVRVASQQVLMRYVWCVGKPGYIRRAAKPRVFYENVLTIPSIGFIRRIVGNWSCVVRSWARPDISGLAQANAVCISMSKGVGS